MTETLVNPEVTVTLDEARAYVLREAEPGESVEVALTEALGLVLAEPVTSDVDLPAFDRAAVDGFAVRAPDAVEGALLRVVGRRARGAGGAETAEIILDQGEAALVAVGTPLPVGADAVVPAWEGRLESGIGRNGALVVLRGSKSGRHVVPRGDYLTAGTLLAPAGTRIRLPMVGLLAAQGCVHPVCHRRVRVALLAVGDHLVGPGEAPVMHRERNASGLAAVAPCLQWGASAHDLGTVRERDLPAALARALTASVVIVLGESEGAIPSALKQAGVEPRFSGVALQPGRGLAYGVVRDGAGRGACHVFHIPTEPIDVVTAVTLLVGPLIARLQGGPAEPLSPLRAAWQGPPHRSTNDQIRAVPVTLAVDDTAQLRATPVDHRGPDDLVGFARADALALLPAGVGSRNVVEVVPLGPWF
ncbi:MAG: molybdopterin molybdotransferase MoeA [Isosphaeraceae bacterium]